MLGFNTGYIEDLYKQYLENPESVSESWREFFADYQPNASFVAASEARAAREAELESPSAPAAPIAKTVAKGSGDGSADAEATLRPLRGPAGKIVENMEASLGVPTATSVRTVPVRLMEENRTLINDYQRYVGGDKISFTHIISYGIVQALKAFPVMNSTIQYDGAVPQHVQPNHVNFGLAIDVEKRGKRSLLVPNIKAAETMSFAEFLGVFNDLVGRARDGKLTVADFLGTSVSITNPGMLGTVLSVPRLMPGQGLIVGVGSISYPTEYYAVSPEFLHTSGMSKVMTITSTYDHRVIQGAESGAFLAYLESLLLGKHDFYPSIFRSLGIPYRPWNLDQDTSPRVAARDQEQEVVKKQASVWQLIRAYRVQGHLHADVNPLGHDLNYHPELDAARYGLSIWDLDREFHTGGLAGHATLPLREILSILRDTYTRKVGIEFMHLQHPAEKRWLQERIEPVRASEPIEPAAKRQMLEKLNAAEAFERFLHTKYIGHKRFSLEGAETLIPMLDMLLSDAADQEVREAVIGMAHRGRLNVLANILNKPYESIFSEFEGNIDPNTTQGSGDVKYHLGSRGKHTSFSGSQIEVTLASNPSHLEAVDPIVEGMVRAKQDLIRWSNADDDISDVHDKVLPVLVHGDAAFAGQGVVAETLNLSQLPGYKTGGTIHIVVNNQIGFTTTPDDARSSTYATDVARMVQAPIFHVNGDDPEACAGVARLALDYRQVFNKDVVIDMVCYRVHGHNEGDEPTYTQPLLYARIEAKRAVRKIYAESLLRRGEMTPVEVEQMLDDFRGKLNEAFDRTHELQDRLAADQAKATLVERKNGGLSYPDTRVSMETLGRISTALSTIPDTFNIHKKLKRQFEKRDDLLHKSGKIDWGFAEALAFGSLLREGKFVRLSGQDSRRGTFSHRHAVLYDQQSGESYIPLNHIESEQGRLLVYDSLLSEYAVCGFDYGYSVSNPSALVLWEAQFGDFSNGAQIIFDQFLSSAESKWGQTSSLVLLLPHGFEGQGPEHSSARLERFLQLCAEDNMVVCNFTSPANYFHALRQQVSREMKKPLVVMSPKSLLRHPGCISSPEDLTERGYLPIIGPAVSNAKRLVLCTGKVYFDLAKGLEDQSDLQETVGIVRIEQLYPLRKDDLVALFKAHPGTSVVWAQEEPANMGAWSHLRYQIDEAMDEAGLSGRVAYAGRPASASPATGMAAIHQLEQALVVEKALRG